MENKKQDIVRVTRFIRDSGYDYLTGQPMTDNMSGITIVADLDYVTNVISIGWSVCYNFNFSKSEGRDRATKRLLENPILVELPESGIPDGGLVNYIFQQFEFQKDNRNTKQFLTAIVRAFS